MTEAERASFMKNVAARGPGKRQVKPTAAFAELLISDDENDEDFEADIKDEDDEDEDSVDDSDEDEDEEEEEEVEHETQDEDSNVVAAAATSATTGSDEPLCGLCLNLRTAVAHEETIQCDKCGLVVHESCYMADVGEDTDSTHSSASTEPWFCEPCIFGLAEPPHCEFCPNRYGAFKRSDIGGRWAHLLCALYHSSAGVTFGDVDHLSAISWQELDYKAFGRKSCAVCTNRLEARTGLVAECDAGMCKNYFHVTCAQKLGLLVDNSELDEAGGGTVTGSSKGDSWMVKANIHSVEPRFLTCKRHANEDEVRVKRQAYLRWEAQEERRMIRLRRRVTTEREERKRLKMQKKTLDRLKGLEGVTICWPQLKTRNRGRMLHTSPAYIEAFAEKAELAGVNREEFEKSFVTVRGETLSFLPPAFSNEFIAYYQEREKHTIVNEERRLQKFEASKEAMKTRQAELEEEFRQLSTQVSEKREENSKAREAANSLFAMFLSLGVREIKMPGKDDQAVVKKRGRRPKAETIAARLSAAIGVAYSPISSQESIKSPPHSPRLLFHACDTCKKTTDQHKLVECDQCHLYFHLFCLEPPLEKMPRKTVNCGWQCSHCVHGSGSDEDSDHSEELGSSTPAEEGASDRKLRVRSSLVKAKQLAEELAQKRAFAAAVRNSRTPVKRGRPPKLPKELKNGQRQSGGPEAKRRRSAADDPLHVEVNGVDENSVDYTDMPTLNAEEPISPRRRASTITPSSLRKSQSPGSKHGSRVVSPRPSTASLSSPRR